MAIQVAAGIAAKALLLPSKKDIAGDIGRGIANGLSMNVSSNMKQFTRKLNDMQKKQLPFVMSKTINDTLKAVRRQIVFKTHPRDFDVKQRSFAKAVYWTKFSNKKKLFGMVYDRLNREYLVAQAKGGIKVKKGRYLAVPTRNRRPIKSKRTYEAVKPKALLQKPRHFVNTNRKTGQLMIFKRKQKKTWTKQGERTPIEGLYILHDSNAVIDKTFRFYEDSMKIARRQFGRRFNVNFKKAMRSARP